MNLTASQRDALQHMADDDGRIVYVPGGWWTTRKYLGTGTGRSIGPTWYVAKGTVRALEKRGLAAATNEGPDYARTREITPAGRAAIGAANVEQGDVGQLAAEVERLLK